MSMYPQVIPEGTGPVKGHLGFFDSCWHVTDRRRVNGGAPAAAAAARTYDLDDVGRDGAMMLSTKKSGGSSWVGVSRGFSSNG